MVVVVVVLVELVEYALLIGQMEPMVVVGLVVMSLVLVVMLQAVVMPLMVVVMLQVVVMPLTMLVMAGPVEYAEELVIAMVLPPLVVVVVVLARHDLEQPEVVDQPVRYLVYTTEWYCRRILQCNSSHLQWGCLPRHSHSLISRVAPLVCMHIGSVFPHINPQPDPPGPWRLLLSS